MPEATLPANRPPDSICPWCSANVTPDATACSSCGAILISDVEADVPGLTAVDAAAAKTESKPKGRSWLPSWITGEHPDDQPSVADLQAIAPPDRNVQREIRRLALEAEVASLQAEVEARYAEAVVEGRVRAASGGADDSGTTDEMAAPAESTDDAESTDSTESSGRLGNVAAAEPQERFEPPAPAQPNLAV